MNIREELFKLQDKEYAKFTFKLTPNIEEKSIIGVRVPALRKFAKTVSKEDRESFLNDLPHKYYEENLLHSIYLSDIRDYEALIKHLRAFLPYVDNWAVCDTIKGKKVTAKYSDEFEKDILLWLKSSETYTIRFAIHMLLDYYLDNKFKPEYHEIVSKIRSDEYYVNMVIAWYFAEALAKQWDATIPYIKTQTLAKWTHNKSIQKAKESFKFTKEQKEYLDTLRV